MRLSLRLLLPAVGAAALAISLLGVSSAGATVPGAHISRSHASHSPKVKAWPTKHKKDPNCIITASPSRFIETGLASTTDGLSGQSGLSKLGELQSSNTESSVAFVFQVECKPEFENQTVDINAPQLNNACQDTLVWYSATGTDGTAPAWGSGEEFPVVLDNDGNATAVVWGGPDCAASSDLVTADLTVAPHTTAQTTVSIAAPKTTPTRLSTYPSSEVEDSNTSSVAVILYAEYPSAYAENSVEFSDAQLNDRCAGGVQWVGPDGQILGTGSSVTTTLDDNGNAFVVALAGPSCGSGKTLAQVDSVGPPYKTLTANFSVLSPRVTDK